MRSHIVRKVFALGVIVATLFTAFLSLIEKRVGAQGSPPAYVITDLGTLGGTTSQSFGLNNSAQVVGSSTLSSGTSHAFLYNTGAMSDLGVLGVNTYQYQCGQYQCGQYQCGTYTCGFLRTCPIYCPIYCPTYCTGTNDSSTAYGVNDAGLVVGVSTTSTTNQTRGFINNAGVVTPLGSFGGLNSEARDVNSNGVVVGWANTSIGSHAFLYSNGTMSDLGTLGGTSSAAYAVNDSATTVGYATTGAGTDHAFIYSGGMFDLGTLGGSHSYAHGVNNSNQIVGYSQLPGNSVTHAFLYTGGSMMDLSTLGGANSYAWGINNSGKVVGMSETSSGNRAFVFDMSTGMRNLNNLIAVGSGWVLQEARAINDAGQIVGQGTFGGQTHAFLLSPTAPAAHNQTVNTDEDTPVNITLTASDFDSTTLTYFVFSPPAHGSLSGDAPNLTYTPSPGYYGPDSFTFIVRDDTNQNSNLAVVSINVASVLDPPVANLILTPPAGNLPLNVVLDGHNSFDPDPGGLITSYAFDFGDGTSYVETESSAPDGSFDGQTAHLYNVAGTYTLSLTVADGTASTNTTATALDVGKGTAIVTLGDLSHTYDGTPKSATAATNPEGLNVTITYSQGETNVSSPTNAGEYAVSATVNDANYEGSATGTLTIARAAPAFSDLSSPVITYATGSTNLAGKLSAGALIPDGNVSITLDNVTQQAEIQPDGTFSSTFDTAALGASATPYEILYSYGGSGNFGAASDNTKTLTVNKAAAEVTLGDLSHTYDGTAKSATATTNPEGLSVTLAYSQGGSPAPAPTDAGSYDVTATVTDANYQGSATETLIIGKATPSFSDLSGPSIIYGTGSTNLAGKIGAGALVPTGEVSITLDGVTQQAAIQPDGTFSSDFNTGTIGASATPYPITYSFGGNNNFDSAADNSKALTVNKATAIVTLANLAHTYDGTPKSATASTGPEGLSLSLSYTRGGLPVASPTEAGDYDVAAIINDDNYQGTASGVLAIAKAAPSFDDLSSAVLTYGAAEVNLSGRLKAGTLIPTGNVSITLNGVSQQAAIDGSDGTFNSVFATDSLGASATPYAVSYSYAGDANFEEAAGSGSLTVNKASGTVTLGDLVHSYDGTPKSATATTSPEGLTVTFAYSQSGASVPSPTDAGDYDVTASLNDANYQGGAGGVLKIGKVTPSFADLSSPVINYGTASTNLAGKISAGSLIPVGDVSVTFNGVTQQAQIQPDGSFSTAFDTSTSPASATPYPITYSFGGSNNFNSAEDTSKSLTISKTAATVTLSDLNQTYDGTGKSASATTTPAGLSVNFTYSRDGSPVTTPTDAGSYDVTATINEANYEGSQTGTLVIEKATAVIDLSDLAHTYDGAAKGAQASTDPQGLAGVSVSYSQGGNAVAAPTEAGEYDVTASLTNDNYQADAATAKLVINKATATITLGNSVHTYNGAPKSATASTSPAGLNVVINYSQGGNPVASPTEVGDYDVTATVNEANYQGTASATLSIQTPPAVSINNVTAVEGNSGATNVVFTVELGAPAPDPVSLSFATADATAAAGSDYTSRSGTLTFAPGETSQTVTVAVKGDIVDEADESFTVNLSNPVNATLSDAAGVCTITDNDAAPGLKITASVPVTEGNAGTINATFAVSLTAASGKTVTVHYSTANGTATQPADYTAKAGDLTFNPGETSKPVTVAVRGDTLDEAAESFKVLLSAPLNATLVVSQGTCTITDNDAPPSLSVSSIAVTEGNAGASNAVFTVKLNAPSGQNVIVKYATANGTATSPADYTGFTVKTLIFSPGETSKPVLVPVKGDLLDEPNETFVFNLSGPVNAIIAVAKGTCTIKDNDAPPGLRVSDVTVTEGNTGVVNAVFRVSLTAASAQTVTVKYQTSNITATAPADYTALPLTSLTFTPGQVLKTVTVAVKGDTLDEPNETFRFQLSAATSATLADGVGVGTITDNDPASSAQEVENLNDKKGAVSTVEFGEASYSVGEGDYRLEVTVRRGGDLSKPLAVEYQTVDGTATERSDYHTAAGTLSFAAGEDAKSFAVIMTDDVYVEGDESLRLMLSVTGGGAALGLNSAAEVSVMDNDNAEGAVNPLDDASFFVRQQFVDTFGREPEPEELSALVKKLNECQAGDTSCSREAVSAGLLLSDEYQSKAQSVLVLYKVVLGRAPLYREFVRELRRLADAEEASQGALSTDEAGFMRRYVERWAELAGARGAREVRAHTEALLEAISKGRREEGRRNEALVLNYYFTLLRRDPDEAGFKYWMAEARKAGASSAATILSGFLDSAEYRERFGPP